MASASSSSEAAPRIVLPAVRAGVAAMAASRPPYSPRTPRSRYGRERRGCSGGVRRRDEGTSGGRRDAEVVVREGVVLRGVRTSRTQRRIPGTRLRLIRPRRAGRPGSSCACRIPGGSVREGPHVRAAVSPDVASSRAPPREMRTLRHGAAMDRDRVFPPGGPMGGFFPCPAPVRRAGQAARRGAPRPGAASAVPSAGPAPARGYLTARNSRTRSLTSGGVVVFVENVAAS
jgi:hypothetical protein